MAEHRSGNFGCMNALGAARFFHLTQPIYNCWLMIVNSSTYARLRIHWGGTEDNDPYDEIRPLHTSWFYAEAGEKVYISSTVQGHLFRLTQSVNKPQMDVFNDYESVDNGNLAAAGVAVTTVINATALAKGHGTGFDVVGEVGGFVGTIEISNDGALTYGAPIPLDAADPNRTGFALEKVFTHLRVTRTAGTFSYVVW